MELHKIAKEDLIFSSAVGEDRTNATVNLAEYDWMNYTVNTRFHTKDLGYIAVKFEYFGCTYSVMSVKTAERYYEYVFDSVMFEKYIKRYLYGFIESIDSMYAFDPEDTLIEWFNSVLDNGSEKVNEDISRADVFRWEWDIPNRSAE